ncbi:uncharacterized protein BKA78DRAFT_310092 [Phyllosticta capitalensis]|uniref:uncharacterized protein n=1 Tax=Phyllosticta capitalensis TaxID=121624 RepID=UPI00312F004E
MPRKGYATDDGRALGTPQTEFQQFGRAAGDCDHAGLLEPGRPCKRGRLGYTLRLQHPDAKLYCIHPPMMGRIERNVGPALRHTSLPSHHNDLEYRGQNDCIRWIGMQKSITNLLIIRSKNSPSTRSKTQFLHSHDLKLSQSWSNRVMDVVAAAAAAAAAVSPPAMRSGSIQALKHLRLGFT